MTPTNQEVMATVEKAAAWLDSKVGFVTACGTEWPADWRDRIDPDKLDLNYGNTCVIGQPLNLRSALEVAYGSPGHGAPHQLGGIPSTESFAPAFICDQHHAAWREYLTATRSEDKKATCSEPGCLDGQVMGYETYGYSARVEDCPDCKAQGRRRPQAATSSREPVNG